MEDIETTNNHIIDSNLGAGDSNANQIKRWQGTSTLAERQVIKFSDYKPLEAGVSISCEGWGDESPKVMSLQRRMLLRHIRSGSRQQFQDAPKCFPRNLYQICWPKKALCITYMVKALNCKGFGGLFLVHYCIRNRT